MQADSLIYQTEKQLKEFGDKVPEDAKSKVEARITSLKEAVEKDDTEAMKAGIEALQQAHARPAHCSWRPLPAGCTSMSDA